MSDAEDFEVVLDTLIHGDEQQKVVLNALLERGVNCKTFAPVNVLGVSRETGVNAKTAIIRLIENGYLERQPATDLSAHNNSYRTLNASRELTNLDEIEL